MIKVILWDIDGTLLNFTVAERGSVRASFEHFQLGECTEELLQRYAKINAEHWKRLELGEISKREVLNGRFAQLFEEFQIPAPDLDVFNRFYQEQLGVYVTFNEGGYEIVRDLRGRVKQYAVTNGTKNAQIRKLSGSGLDQLLDGVFISEDVGVEKPGIGFFDAIWKEIGTYDGSEVMIVGDSLTSDMQGGNNAGILCCWYNPEGNEKPSYLRIDHDVKRLSDILQIIG